MSFLLSVFMLNVIMPSALILSVVAPTVRINPWFYPVILDLAKSAFEGKNTQAYLSGS
jgi:hypothetical protein